MNDTSERDPTLGPLCDTTLPIMHHLGTNMLSYMQRWWSVPLKTALLAQTQLVARESAGLHTNPTLQCCMICIVLLTILLSTTDSSHITFLLNVSSVPHCFAESLMMMVEQIWLERPECLMTSTETERAVCGSECLTGPLTWIPSKGHTEVIHTDTSWVKS